jgi:hypothetical protein
VIPIRLESLLGCHTAVGEMMISFSDGHHFHCIYSIDLLHKHAFIFVVTPPPLMANF